MIYMNGKNDLEECAKLNYDQIRSVGSTGEVNVVVGLGLLSWDHTYRIRATPAATLSTTAPAMVEGVVDLGKVNMGSREGLSRFIAGTKRAYPASRYLLIIWDHGQGWRYYLSQFLASAAERVGPSAGARGFAIPARSPVRPDSRVSSPKSISRDDEYGTRLFDVDIQHALESDPVDIIGFDACLMSMVETAHALRLGARWMIGSEEVIPGTGWKYDDWLATLTRTPDLDGREVCRLIGNSYMNAYGEHAKDPYYHEKQITLAAVDLGLMRSKRLVTSISLLADRLRVLIEGGGLAIIKAARANCAEYASMVPRPGGWPRYQHVDLVRFCQQLITQSNGADPRLERLARGVIRDVRRVVAFRWCGEQSCGEEPAGERWGSYGLAIYFPATRQILESDLEDPRIGRGYEIDNTDHPVEFVSDRGIHWASFVHSYVSSVPR
jgi:hypothetical protein